MNTIANFSIWFGQASELKVDTPDRSQPLQRMATRISLIGGALGFTILGIDLTWILAAATMLCTFLSPLECRAGVSPVVLQDFVDWEKQHRGSWIQVTDYDSAAKCFRMTPAVYNEEFAAMAVGYVHSDPNILMWRYLHLPGRFFTAATRELFRWSIQSPFPLKLLHNQLNQERDEIMTKTLSVLALALLAVVALTVADKAQENPRITSEATTATPTPAPTLQPKPARETMILLRQMRCSDEIHADFPGICITKPDLH